jgi:DNA-binding NtrC family response regulator
MDTTPLNDYNDRWSRSLRRPGDRIEMARRMGLVGRSEAIQKVVVSIVQIASTNSTVLITGETGTGKEVVARAIHDASTRSSRPFVALNISALNEGTLESELFGHEKGAFTDAVRRKEGIFEAAGSGTVFLDEIGDVSPGLQVRLLRVLEEREFKRVGGTDALKAEARVVAATNRNLEHAVHSGDFRADLYYRLRVFEIHLPPLRERKDDIPLLVEHFATRLASDNNQSPPRIEDDAMDLYLAYDWPGNVRELRTVVERMMITLQGPVVGPDDVPDLLRDHVAASRMLPVIPQRQTTPQQHELEVIYRALLDLRADVHEMRRLISDRIGEGEVDDWLRRQAPRPVDDTAHEQNVVEIEVAPQDEVNDMGRANNERHAGTLKDMERSAIKTALDLVHGNRREAAKRLGIGERTLYRKIKEYDLT